MFRYLDWPRLEIGQHEGYVRRAKKTASRLSKSTIITARVRSWRALHPQEDQAQDGHRVIASDHHRTAVVLRHRSCIRIYIISGCIVSDA
jgi:hypothetical protein